MSDKELLAEFWQNEPMREAVFKMIMTPLEVRESNETRTDAELGSLLRATWVAKGMVMNAFNEIESQQSVKVDDKDNPAR